MPFMLPFSRGSSQTQGSNPRLPHCGRIPYQLSHKGSGVRQRFFPPAPQILRTLPLQRLQPSSFLLFALYLSGLPPLPKIYGPTRALNFLACSPSWSPLLIGPVLLATPLLGSSFAQTPPTQPSFPTPAWTPGQLAGLLFRK